MAETLSESDGRVEIALTSFSERESDGEVHVRDQRRAHRQRRSNSENRYYKCITRTVAK